MGVVDPKNDMKVGTVCHGMSYGCGAGAWGHALHEDECKTPPALARLCVRKPPSLSAGRLDLCADRAPCGAYRGRHKQVHAQRTRYREDAPQLSPGLAFWAPACQRAQTCGSVAETDVCCANRTALAASFGQVMQAASARGREKRAVAGSTGEGVVGSRFGSPPAFILWRVDASKLGNRACTRAYRKTLLRYCIVALY